MIKAHVADRLGNLVHRKTARNFGPIMATAATTTIVEVSGVVDAGALDPEAVVTPSIYVDRILDRSAILSKLVSECTYPLTGLAGVKRVYTDYALFTVGTGGLTIQETWGISAKELSARLSAD